MINTLARIYSTDYEKAFSRLSAPAGEDRLTAFRLTEKDVSSLLETAKRFALSVLQYRQGGNETIVAAIRDEKSKAVRFAYSLLISRTPPHHVREAFVSAGFSNLPSKKEACEVYMLIAGVSYALNNAHCIVLMEAMCAFLGLEASEAAEKWMIQDLPRGRKRESELIMPGELPEVLVSRCREPGVIDLALRLTGLQFVAAALAGCPDETIGAVKAQYSELGARMLEEEIGNSYDRLSTDEIADAQSALLELVDSIQREKLVVSRDEEAAVMNIDSDLVSDITNLVLELDEKLLKTVATAMDPRSLAMLIQAMEPLAHDRLLFTMGKSKESKVLNALEISVPAANVDLVRKAQLFAQNILAAVAPRNREPGKKLQLPLNIRNLLTSILSRE